MRTKAPAMGTTKKGTTMRKKGGVMRKGKKGGVMRKGKKGGVMRKGKKGG